MLRRHPMKVTPSLDESELQQNYLVIDTVNVDLVHTASQNKCIHPAFPASLLQPSQEMPTRGKIEKL